MKKRYVEHLICGTVFALITTWIYVANAKANHQDKDKGGVLNATQPIQGRTGQNTQNLPRKNVKWQIADLTQMSLLEEKRCKRGHVVFVAHQKYRPTTQITTTLERSSGIAASTTMNITKNLNK